MCTAAGPNVHVLWLYIVLVHASIHWTEEVKVWIKLV